MPIVEAQCIGKAFDNLNSRAYFPGFVQDYDTENEKLNSLTTNDGKWIFQYDGHRGGPARKQATTKAEVPQTIEAAPAKPKKTMSEAHKKKMAEGRARNKALKESEAA